MYEGDTRLGKNQSIVSMVLGYKTLGLREGAQPGPCMVYKLTPGTDTYTLDRKETEDLNKRNLADILADPLLDRTRGLARTLLPIKQHRRATSACP